MTDTRQQTSDMRQVPHWLLVIAVSLLLGPVDASAAAEPVQAGVAQETFTLPRWVPLAGYSRRRGHASSGTHDPVGVRALVLEDADTVAALVSCDLLIIDEHLFEAVRRRLLANGFPPETVLVLAATHTHSGPGAYGTRFFEKLSMGHFDRDVFELIAETISRTVLRARAARTPARVATAAAAVEGLVHNRMDPHGLVEHELTVTAVFHAASSTPRAILVGFAAHPTTLGAWNMQLSGDYPGVLVRELEQDLPGTTALFFAGAVADQAPEKTGEGFASAEHLGGSLARAAEALVRQAHPQTPASLHAIQERLPLPPARIRLGSRVTLPGWFGRQFADDDATLSVLAVGPAVFVGVPCDVTAAFGRQLTATARARGLAPMIIGFASDYIGYCLPASLYNSGTYEASLALNGPQAGELVVNRLTGMLNELVP